MENKYTRKQWTILLVYSVINLVIASSVSLQGPFYPMIAEQKGVTPTQYGFVLGIFSIGVFIMSPIVGVLIGKFGIVRISFSGLSIIGVTNILFGFVNKINGFSIFLGISIVIRVLEAVGFAMVRNAGIAIVSLEFVANIEMAFAFTQTFFSIGQLLGPVIGGALFELGGFLLPFLAVGALLLLAAGVVLFLPKDYPKHEEKLGKEIFCLFRIPYVILGISTLFGTFINFGFITTALEPHLKSLSLSPVEVGSMFLCNAIAFSFSNLAWGKLCEKYDYPALIICISSIFIICGFLLLGPAPYISLEMSIYTCVFGLLSVGLGSGGGQVSGFSCLNKGAKLAGLPQNVQSSGIVSAIFTSSLSLSYFAGSFLGGYLFETFDFPWASHLFILYHLILFIVLVIYVHFGAKFEENLTSEIGSTNNETIF